MFIHLLTLRQGAFDKSIIKKVIPEIFKPTISPILKFFCLAYLSRTPPLYMKQDYRKKRIHVPSDAEIWEL